MPRHSGQNRRDLGLTGAGKGDAPRYNHDENWTRNFSEIEFGKSEGFVEVSKGRFRKSYGPASVAKEVSDDAPAEP